MFTNFKRYHIQIHIKRKSKKAIPEFKRFNVIESEIRNFC